MKHSHWSLIVQNLQILNTGNNGNIGDADIVGFDNCEKVETFKKLESVNIIMANGKRFNKHLSIRHFILSMAVIILSTVYLPANAASTDTTISGADVPSPKIITPIKKLGTFSFFASAVAPSIKTSALQTKIAKPSNTATTANHISNFPYL